MEAQYEMLKTRYEISQNRLRETIQELSETKTRLSRLERDQRNSSDVSQAGVTVAELRTEITTLKQDLTVALNDLFAGQHVEHAENQPHNLPEPVNGMVCKFIIY